MRATAMPMMKRMPMQQVSAIFLLKSEIQFSMSRTSGAWK